MNYKVSGALKKSKKSLIIAGILWIILAIVFVAPVTCLIVESTVNGSFVLDRFFNAIGPAFSNIGQNIGKVFTANYIGTYFSTLLYFSIIYIVCAIIGIIKAAPKSEYTDIEHGSSDWAENGEQYRVLSKNKGILLAENNYLPTDKRGNTNVLIVGRIW